SSTAGKPILGQINANELTDILIIVVRYFGGVELGTSGLITAYRTSAAEAIAASEIEERTVDSELTVVFEYPCLNGIMRVVKEEQPEIVSQKFEMTCEMTLRIRKNLFEQLKNRILKVETAYLKE
ncbi:MAG: YigZ family protein, partial [Tannerella sp.]|nr:YigZ family protein [Tannerella sp.]